MARSLAILENMRQGTIETTALLLRRTQLSDNSGIIELFTPEYGRISVGARYLQKSKKMRKELDFFRIMKVQLFQGRSRMSLRRVQTTHLLSAFLTKYETLTIGYEWLQRIRDHVPEGTPCPSFFKTTLAEMTAFDPECTEACDVRFLTQVMHFAGLCPIWDDELNHIDKKMIGFMRDAPYSLFLKKKNQIPHKAFELAKKRMFQIMESL